MSKDLILLYALESSSKIYDSLAFLERLRIKDRKRSKYQLSKHNKRIRKEIDVLLDYLRSFREKKSSNQKDTSIGIVNWDQKSSGIPTISNFFIHIMSLEQDLDLLNARYLVGELKKREYDSTLKSILKKRSRRKFNLKRQKTVLKKLNKRLDNLNFKGFLDEQNYSNLKNILLQEIANSSIDEQYDLIDLDEKIAEKYPQKIRPLIEESQKKVTITITGTDGKCSFLLEIPGTSPIKLKQEIKLDVETKKTLVKEYEKAAILANYLSSTRSGLTIPKPVQLSNLDMKEHLQQLGNYSYRLLIPKKISDYLQVNTNNIHLWLEVDESLIDIPWELMYDKDQFLCMRSAIGRRLLTEENIAASDQRDSRYEKLKILMIGNPSEDLDESQQETEILYQNMLNIKKTEITKYVGTEITKRNFLTALTKGYNIIHYAGHAEFNKQEPDRSLLKFKDGFCYAYEIRQFLSDNPPLLAFMNACSSARESDMQTSKYETNIPSLARVFLYAGVRAYIGSMWPVHNSSAAAFAILFYKYLINGHTIGDAMRRARINIYQKGTKNEVGWSPFILYGDPETRLVKSII